MLRTRQENDDRSETDEAPETVLADAAARTTRRAVAPAVEQVRDRRRARVMSQRAEV